MKIDISIGEAIDRLTILKIKLLRINDDQKLNNVRNEHTLLEQNIYSEYPDIEIFPLRVDHPLFGKLYEVNLQLWDVEDKLRDMEREKNFNDNFIELARSVYYLNDKRAEIKKEINIHYKSELVEEKSYQKY